LDERVVPDMTLNLAPGKVHMGSIAAPPQPPRAVLLGAARKRFGHTGGGLPDPDAIRARKAALAAEVQQKLKEGTEALAKQHERQKEQLHKVTEQQKARFKLALDGQVKSEEYTLSQQYNEQLMRLQQTAQAKRAELEQQATNLVLEFQQKKLQEEFLVQQRDIKKQHQEAQQRLAADLQRLCGTSAEQPTMQTPLLVHRPSLEANPVSTNLLLASSMAPACATYAAPPKDPMQQTSLAGVLQYVPPSGARSPSGAMSPPSLAMNRSSSFQFEAAQRVLPRVDGRLARSMSVGPRALSPDRIVTSSQGRLSLMTRGRQLQPHLAG